MASWTSADAAKFGRAALFIPRCNKSRPWTATAKGQVISARLHTVYYYSRLGTWGRSNFSEHLRRYAPPTTDTKGKPSRNFHSAWSVQTPRRICRTDEESLQMYYRLKDRAPCVTSRKCRFFSLESECSWSRKTISSCLQLYQQLFSTVFISQVCCYCMGIHLKSLLKRIIRHPTVILVFTVATRFISFLLNL